MSKQQILKVLKNGGRIGGHSLVLFDASGAKVGKVSRSTIEALMTAGTLHVINQAYKLA